MEEEADQIQLARGAVLERRLGGVALRLLPRVHLRRGKPQNLQQTSNPGPRLAARRDVTYGLERVGEDLGDDATAGAREAVDQRVRHPPACSYSPVPTPSSSPRLAGRRITASSRPK